MQNPVIAFASAPPPPHMSKALSAVRQENSTAATLRSALDGVDAELALAEAVVDRLEAERQNLLIAGAERAVDEIERRITVANRHVEALAAAKRQLPDRLSARRAIESDLDQRAASAREQQRRGLEILVDLHPLAVRMAELMTAYGSALNEIEETNTALSLQGLPAIDRPFEALARHVGCDASEVPEVHSWWLGGYFQMPAAPDRQLVRAKEVLKLKGRK
jgi:chromosome segregation ATPase